MKARWNGVVVAESYQSRFVEGKHYFPPDALRSKYFEESSTRNVIPSKGTAHYYTLKVGDRRNPDAAWYYVDTTDAAKRIEGYVVFGEGVEVSP